MNIFHKVALQGLKKSRTRTLVTIIGVILSSAMITGVTTFGISLLNYLVNGAADKYGNYHAAFFDVPYSFVEERSQDKEIKNIAVLENIGYAAVRENKSPEKPYYFIVGYNDKSFQNLPVTLISGRLPENNREVIISGSIIRDAGLSYSIGDTISLAVGNRFNGAEKLGQSIPYNPKEKLVLQEGKNYTITGICQTPIFEQNSSPGYTLITKSDTPYTSDDFSLFVALKNPRHVYSYVNNVKNDYAYSFNNHVLRFLGISKNSADIIFNTLLYSVGGIVIIIIMIGSVFLIHNAFNISLNERMHQFGILLSIGATEKQLLNSVLFEGLCIGMMGIPFGIFAGIGGISLVLSVVVKNLENILYDNVPLRLIISIPILIIAAFISLITILISAYIPARKAAGTPVMECIRQTNEIKVESKMIKTSKFTERIYGLEGMLALKNFKRNKKRCRSIILSLVLSIVLFISTNAFIIELKQASEMAVIFTTYDIGISTMDMEDKEMLALYDKLKVADNVYKSSYQAVLNYSCTVSTDELSDTFQAEMQIQPSEKTASLSVNMQFLDDNTYLEELKQAGLKEEEYTGQNAKLIAIAKVDNHINRLLDPDDFKDIFSNSSIGLTVVPEIEDISTEEYRREVNLTFVNIVGEDILPALTATEPSPYIFTIIIPWSLKETFNAPDDCVYSKGLTFCSKNSSQSEKDIKNIIIKEGITANYILYNTTKLFQENSNMIFIANVFGYTFIVIISLIAVANIFNTISTNIKLRRREFAMLRSVGISDRGFQKMMNLECVFYGLKALFFGLPIALLASWLIYYGISSGGAEDIDFVLPLTSIGISIFSVFFIIFITMLYSISKIKKENIIDALRDDLT